MRFKFTSEKSLPKILLKPRLGIRMCSGIWPPSKPYTLVPVRALAPLTPRPDVLPRPEDEPRPTLSLCFCAPGLLRISLSFMSLPFLDDFDEVLDGGDHAAHGRCVLERARAANLAQTQPAQGLRLDLGLAVGGGNLAARAGCPAFRCGLVFLLGHGCSLLLALGRCFGGGRAFALGQDVGDA